MQKAYLTRLPKFQTLSVPTGTKSTHILRVVAMLNTEACIQKLPANPDGLRTLTLWPWKWTFQ